MALGDDAAVLDPWNGGGTTTQAVYDCGRAAVGFDINPVMAVLAKARLLESDVKDSLRVLGARLPRRQLRSAHLLRPSILSKPGSPRVRPRH